MDVHAISADAVVLPAAAVSFLLFFFEQDDNDITNILIIRTFKKNPEPVMRPFIF
jgi:hypothetical protein